MSKQMQQIDPNEKSDPDLNDQWSENTTPPVNQNNNAPQESPLRKLTAWFSQIRKKLERRFSGQNKTAPLPSEQDPFQAETSPEIDAKAGINFLSSASAITRIVIVAVLVSTLLNLLVPGQLSSNSSRAFLSATQSAQELSSGANNDLPANFPVKRIGIVVGHRGNDSGAVCANGLTELEVNSNIATFVQQKLVTLGYEVDLLDEFDARLNNYQAGLLLSIHADSCEYINDTATGFKVAATMSESKQESAKRLVQCLADRYGKMTGLKYHFQSITPDMSSYHAFNEINPYTTAGIIETGFLNLDQTVLTTKPELLADGIVAGIRCYLENEDPGPQP